MSNVPLVRPGLMTRRSSLPECVKSPGTTFTIFSGCLNVCAGWNVNFSMDDTLIRAYAMEIEELAMVPQMHGQSLLVGVQNERVQACPWSDYAGEEYPRTHNWSPLKSPKATTLSPLSNPLLPASMREFPVNRLGGKGHIECTGWNIVVKARMEI